MRRFVLASLVVASSAQADPLRLRADARASTAAPAGLLVLEAAGAVRTGLSAEAVVWLGDETADVLVVAVRGVAMDGRVHGKVGRFVAMLGAIRPVHVDGASARVRLPHRIDVEAMAGIPVLPASLVAGRAWDWFVGGRVARRFGDYGSVGLAFAEQRDAGRLAMEEVGADAGLVLGKRSDMGARIAYDLANPGLAEASVTATRRMGPHRVELYAVHRATSHLVPATSLFSVLGDVPSQRAGSVLTWRAAPRLTITGDLAVRRIDAELGEELVGRARLDLDDTRRNAVTAELRRSGAGGWTGARIAGRIALPHAIALATELELVRPDSDERGALWPWGLVGASWERADWQLAVAVEASASPEYTHRVDAIFQLARRWSTK